MFTAHDERAKSTKDFVTQESVYRVDPLNGTVALYRAGDQGIDPHTTHNASVRNPQDVFGLFGLPHTFIKNPSWFDNTPQAWLAAKSDTFDTAYVRGAYNLDALRKKVYVTKGEATGRPAGYYPKSIVIPNAPSCTCHSYSTRTMNSGALQTLSTTGIRVCHGQCQVHGF
jgi:hypothetical protein